MATLISALVARVLTLPQSPCRWDAEPAWSPAAVRVCASPPELTTGPRPELTSGLGRDGWGRKSSRIPWLRSLGSSCTNALQWKGSILNLETRWQRLRIDEDKKLLSPCSHFDVRSTFHASIAANKEGGGILVHPGCLVQTDLLLDVSSKVKALSIRLSGYTVEDTGCNDAFWCTVWLTGHLSTLCDRGALSCFSWRFFLSLTNHKKGNCSSISSPSLKNTGSQAVIALPECRGYRCAKPFCVKRINSLYSLSLRSAQSLNPDWALTSKGFCMELMLHCNKLSL